MTTRPAEPEHLPCPRCDSINTKFCYYNNYNLSQPRHFCKSCRRYWTRGGTLRNVPVGGGSRKSSSSSYSSVTKRARPNPSSSSVVTSTTSSYSNDMAPHHEPPPPLHAAPVPMVSNMSTGSGHVADGSFSGCDVNLNEAVPEAATNFNSFLTTTTTHQVGPATGYLPYGREFGPATGMGLHGIGFGLGMLDFPMESVGHHGNGSVGGGGGGSSGCNTWQMGSGGGGVEEGLGDPDDCFGWSELAISMQGIKGLK